MRTSDGKSSEILTVVDEYSLECLSIHAPRKITAFEVIEQLTDLFPRRRIPEHLSSHNGWQFTAHVIRRWLKRLGVKTLHIEPGSAQENGYVESFNGKLRDELLNQKSSTRWRKRKSIRNGIGGSTCLPAGRQYLLAAQLSGIPATAPEAHLRVQ